MQHYTCVRVCDLKLFSTTLFKGLWRSENLNVDIFSSKLSMVYIGHISAIIDNVINKGNQVTLLKKLVFSCITFDISDNPGM